MAEWAPPPHLRTALDRVKSNLRSWNPAEWVVFWGLVPAFLILVYVLPQPVRDAYFVLDTLRPWNLQAWFLSSYAHSQLYPHLVGNLATYFIVLLMIFAFEDNRRRFRILAGWSFLAVPFISSLLTIIFWGLIDRATMGQGFSAIIGALLAYAIFIFVIWGVQDALVLFDHPELFRGPGSRLVVLRFLLTLILLLIILMGLLSGIFMDAGGSVSNGLAHFGGFITSLAVLLAFDLRFEDRRSFDVMLGIAILLGIGVYMYYLAQLVRLVKGG